MEGPMTTQSPLPYAIQQEVVHGATIGYQDEHSAILKKGQRVHHITHLIVTLLTGVWFWVWLYLGLTGGERQIHLSITPGSSVVTREETKDALPLWVKIVWGLAALGWVLILVQIFS
jgi:hypothetical protein